MYAFVSFSQSFHDNILHKKEDDTKYSVSYTTEYISKTKTPLLQPRQLRPTYDTIKIFSQEDDKKHNKPQTPPHDETHPKSKPSATRLAKARRPKISNKTNHKDSKIKTNCSHTGCLVRIRDQDSLDHVPTPPATPINPGKLLFKL